MLTASKVAGQLYSSFSSNSPLLCYLQFELVPSNLRLWRNFVKFVIFVEFAAFRLPSTPARSLKTSTLAKFRQIRHFCQIRFRRIRRFRATLHSSSSPEIFDFREISPNSSFSLNSSFSSNSPLPCYPPQELVPSNL